MPIVRPARSRIALILVFLRGDDLQDRGEHREQGPKILEFDPAGPLAGAGAGLIGDRDGGHAELDRTLLDKEDVRGGAAAGAVGDGNGEHFFRQAAPGGAIDVIRAAGPAGRHHQGARPGAGGLRPGGSRHGECAGQHGASRKFQPHAPEKNIILCAAQLWAELWRSQEEQQAVAFLKKMPGRAASAKNF
jgi:hypothetical protein